MIFYGDSFLHTVLLLFLSYGLVVSICLFLFSAFVDNAIGPIITTMAIIIIFLIISAINVDIFQSIKPYLFTSYMGAWSVFFNKPLDSYEIIKSALIMLGHIAGLFCLTTYIFYKKDILT